MSLFQKNNFFLVTCSNCHRIFNFLKYSCCVMFWIHLSLCWSVILSLNFMTNDEIREILNIIKNHTPFQNLGQFLNGPFLKTTTNSPSTYTENPNQNSKLYYFTSTVRVRRRPPICWRNTEPTMICFNFVLEAEAQSIREKSSRKTEVYTCCFVFGFSPL